MIHRRINLILLRRLRHILQHSKLNIEKTRMSTRIYKAEENFERLRGFEQEDDVAV